MQNRLADTPPATHVLRPERDDHGLGLLDAVSRRITGGLLQIAGGQSRGMSGFLSTVERYGHDLESRPDKDMNETAAYLREHLHRAGFHGDLVAHAYALIREVASRTVGLRHFHTQLMGGRVLLKGRVAEMETGEGKTLTATLAAGTAALAGVPVHVITVNDYLTDRDAVSMGPLYRALGLTVGCAVHGMAPEAKRAAYACDVCYCTNKEIVFDYLRDWITLEGRQRPIRLQAERLHGNGARVQRLLLRGLHFAIVDEADSVLIDEARTPLIISKATRSDDERVFMEQAMGIAEKLEPGLDYAIENLPRKIKLTPGCRQRVRDLAGSMGPLWTGEVRREEIIGLALTARHLFVRDEHYLVQDGKVQIIDEFTGRVMPDRSYERGLHQLIEIKEGCAISQAPETQARISYQKFFKRYLRLAGMTGTAREVRKELWAVYGLWVERLPTCRKMQRTALPDQIFPTEEEKWRAVADKIGEMHRIGRPVLVGTRSVSASEKAARLLTERDCPYRLLNAKQDQEEAAIIRRAGEAGCVTIATNMAGRGTDIKLGAGIASKQGLHVILTERHEARRIDRQLAGRCGRLGDPGSYGAILSLEDPILHGGQGGLAGWIAKRIVPSGSGLWVWLVRRAIFSAQKRVERLHAKMRKNLVKEDQRRGNMLSFSGRSE